MISSASSHLGSIPSHCEKSIGNDDIINIVGSLEEAVFYGKAHFEKFYSLKDFDLVKDCAALLAYLEPKKSPVGYLLKDTQRENVADDVNAMILSTNLALKD
ncbi:Ran-binding protein M homolog isoform X2 [Tanacetum coccineum]